MTAALGGTEGVERLQEDIEDGMADANEIQEAMSRQMDLPGVEGMDDDDLLAELEGLEEEELTAELSKVELAAPSAGWRCPPCLCRSFAVRGHPRDLCRGGGQAAAPSGR